jgi:hypothetical protein
MPRVGKKHFSYGPEGMAAAEKASKMMGKPMEMTASKRKKMGKGKKK